MKTIYNTQGEAKTCDAVDACEHIATGRWFAEAPAAAPAPANTNTGVDTSRMNKVALLAYLASLGIDAPETATKAELLKLLA